MNKAMRVEPWFDPNEGETKSALQRLKELPDVEQREVMAWLRNRRYREVRPAVEAKAGVPCPDYVLSRFYSWQEAREQAEKAVDVVGQVERLMRAGCPELTAEQAFNRAVSFFMVRSVAQREVKDFVTVAKLELAVKRARREGW